MDNIETTGVIEHESRKNIDLLVVGMGKMGSKILGVDIENLKVVGLGRDTENYDELIGRSQVIMLATKQADGLKWLKKYGKNLDGESQLVVSLVGFVDFDTLELATKNDNLSLVRVMTNTGLNRIAWSDDGSLNESERVWVGKLMSRMGGEVGYLGVRADERLNAETMDACEKGWLASDIHDHAVVLSQNLGISTAEAESRIADHLQDLLKKYEQRQSFQDSFKEVATVGGATEAGAGATKLDFLAALRKRFSAGVERAREIRGHWAEEVKKGLAAQTN